jgi:hypothetical protein
MAKKDIEKKEERVETTDYSAVIAKVLQEFPLIPPALVKAVINAETGYNPAEYYEFKADYWKQVMSKMEGFWRAVYKLQYDKIDHADELARKYSATYGIMQVMYDVVLDLHLKDLKEGRTLANAVFEFERSGKLNEDSILSADRAEELNGDDELAMWYGCSELRDRMKDTFDHICQMMDKGNRKPTLEKYLSGEEKVMFLGKNIDPFEFYKFTIASYQSSPETITKMLGIMKAEGRTATWENLAPYIQRTKSAGFALRTTAHVTRAFEGLSKDDFKPKPTKQASA